VAKTRRRRRRPYGEREFLEAERTDLLDRAKARARALYHECAAAGAGDRGLAASGEEKYAIITRERISARKAKAAACT
jgi:hypothetical protein